MNIAACGDHMFGVVGYLGWCEPLDQALKPDSAAELMQFLVGVRVDAGSDTRQIAG